MHSSSTDKAVIASERPTADVMAGSQIRGSSGSKSAAESGPKAFSGRYLMRLLRIAGSTNTSSNTTLVRMLTSRRSNHATEICESFAATQALFDFDRHHNLGLRQMQKVAAFIPRDGCRPCTAAALLLQVPTTWTAFSIDPALASGKAAALLTDQPRLHLVPSTLEMLTLDEPPLCDVMAAADAVVVLAVHSHAPLQSFWSRLPSSVLRVCVSIPCCGDYGWLSTDDLRQQYMDGEINSAGADTVLVYERKAEKTGPAEPTVLSQA